MAEEGTLCTNADVLKYSGADASSTSSAEAYTNVYIKSAEAFICMYTTYDWVTNYSSLSTIGKELLREATACLAAMPVIAYDIPQFNLSATAQTMLDFLYSRAIDIMKMITTDEARQFVFSGDVDAL